MISHMMDLFPTLLFFAITLVTFLILAGGATYTVLRFRDIGKNPDKHVPCPDTFPCGDRVPMKRSA